MFPPLDEDDKYYVLPYFWLPEETLDLRVRRDHVNYDVWERQGYIQTTEGNVVHYGYIEKFIEKVEVVIPDGMIDEEVEKMVEEMNANLSYQGLNIDQYLQYMGITLEDYKKEMRAQAEKRIKLNLGLEAVAKEEKVEVSDEEIDAKIKELSAQYGAGDDESLLKNENARNYMRQELTHEKTMKIVTDNAVEK